MTANVGTPGKRYDDAARKGQWKMLGDFLGGTEAVRNPTYLPKNPRESKAAWDFRIQHSYLFPGFKGAVDALTALPFQKPVTVDGQEDLPEMLQPILDDADRQGTSLHDFSHLLDEVGVTYGCAYIVVDYPQRPSDNTKAFDAAFDARPYFRAVSPANLIRVTEARDATGRKQVTGIAIKEVCVEPLAEGSYEEGEVEYVTEITSTTWKRWRKAANSPSYLLESEGVHSFGVVPVVPIVYDRDGPPLLDLVWLNLRHLQSESAQDTALSFARIPVLFGAGFSTEEVKSINEVGPGQGIFARSADAKLGTVEHNGAAIEAGRLHGRDILEQMVALGAQPLTEQVSTTATGEQRQDRRSTSRRQEWANALQNALNAAYRMAADVLGKELPEEFSVKINGDFILAAQEQLHLQALATLRNARDISQETMIAEHKRRGVLSANVDAEHERELVEQEGPDLAGIKPDEDEDEEEPEDDEEQAPPVPPKPGEDEAEPKAA